MSFIKQVCLIGGLALGSLMAQPALAEMTRISWYGPGFEGSYTASGEQFNRWAHTAAHPSWPFGTLVQLTNPNTGASVTVRINDRSGGRLDVSEQAAIDLGVRSQGIASVRVEVLEWGR
ncbi:MAG: septal ring lytic transglycosylase RlpA family protein [Leptolyngbya sp. SIO4C1]|nr:septal ring lytic transglycosylase RlpA family protein [Leptolyngbya sp. SIO4C1]